MSDIVLHHYPKSPYAEKVRLALGLKRVRYHSVIVPSWMPKPDLVPLTGGYRRTPVMQVGADVFCDTSLILREIDRMVPEPPLFPAEGARLTVLLGLGLERALFLSAIGIVIGLHGSSYPREVIEDRAPFFGFSIEPEGMRARQSQFVDRFNALATELCGMLGDGRAFVQGSKPSAADLCLYHPIWYLRNSGGEAAMALLPVLTDLVPWADRVASLGHGTPLPLPGADALAIAAAAEPRLRTEGTGPCELAGLQLGQQVSMTPEDFGRDPVAGTLVATSEESVTLRRRDPLLGTIDVHFPRLGFDAVALDR